MKRAIRAVPFLISAVWLIAAAPKTQFYRNGEFGIVAPVPRDVLLCPTPKGEHDDGPVFLLGSTDVKGCHNPEWTARLIDVFASPNVVDETKKLNDFLKSECADVLKGPCLPPPNGLQIPGLPSEAARVNHPNGWIDILVVTQAGKPNRDFDPSVPSVNYLLLLHTRREHFEEDLRIFRTILETVRLSPTQ